MPIVHVSLCIRLRMGTAADVTLVTQAATFTLDAKPQLLVDAVRACGALYVKTKRATEFVKRTLASSRERLSYELVSFVFRVYKGRADDAHP
jgi:hypothetical protein